MIRLGIIGLGRRLAPMVENFRSEAAGNLAVVGIVDPDVPGATARLNECDRGSVRFFRTLKELMHEAKPDALAIGTRCDLHTPYAIQALAYGLPLFLEKPVATSMKQALALERAYEKNPCATVVSFPLRVSPLCDLTRQYIEQGAIGRPEHILGVNYVPYGTCYFDQFYRDYSVTQGLFLQKATHDFDYMANLMNSGIVRVSAMATCGHVFGGKKRKNLSCSKCDEAEVCPESPGNRKRNRSGGVETDHLCLFSKDIGTPETGMNEDSSSALLGFASGAHGVYTQVFYSRRDAATRGATLSGYKGTLSFDWYTNKLRHIRHHAPFSDLISAETGMAHFGGDEELARDFIGLIQKNRPSRVPFEAGLSSVYACLAAKLSVVTQRSVKVRQPFQN